MIVLTVLTFVPGLSIPLIPFPNHDSNFLSALVKAVVVTLVAKLINVMLAEVVGFGTCSSYLKI